MIIKVILRVVISLRRGHAKLYEIHEKKNREMPADNPLL